MNLKFFGDSYDIVKQSLLRWLEPCGAWKAHPMFTPPVDPRRADEFARFLGVPLVSKEVLSQRYSRDVFLSHAKSCSAHLFLDPDTGLRMPPGSATKRHVTGQELVCIAKKRPDKLTLVFDQSFSRSSPRHEQPNEKLPEACPDGMDAALDKGRSLRRQQLKRKLSWLAEPGRDVHGVAYESHACFVLVSASKYVLDDAVGTLLRESRLPPDRLVGA